MGGDGADAGDPVGRGGHPQAGAGDQQCPVGLAGRDEFSCGDRHRRVRVWLVASTPTSTLMISPRVSFSKCMPRKFAGLRGRGTLSELAAHWTYRNTVHPVTRTLRPSACRAPKVGRAPWHLRREAFPPHAMQMRCGRRPSILCRPRVDFLSVSSLLSDRQRTRFLVVSPLHVACSHATSEVALLRPIGG